MRFDAYPYGRVAAIYDALAGLYSLGRIERSKRCQLGSLEAGERALFVGVGGGSDALEAARRGVRVTAIDLSGAMLARFGERLARSGLEAERIEGDVAGHRPAEPYDVVVAHYFLNLYSREVAAAMLAKLVSLLRPGGRLLVADFAPAAGGQVGRWLTAAYYRPVNWIAWLLGLCALHPIPDYPVLFAEAGLELREMRRFPVVFGRDPAYHALLAQRPDRPIASGDRSRVYGAGASAPGRAPVASSRASSSRSAESSSRRSASSSKPGTGGIASASR